MNLFNALEKKRRQISVQVESESSENHQSDVVDEKEVVSSRHQISEKENAN